MKKYEIYEVTKGVKTLVATISKNNDSYEMKVLKKNNEGCCEPRLVENNEVNIREVLLYVGIRPNLKGYRYFKYALEEGLVKDNNVLMTKEVYPEIAKYFKVSWTSVERSMRHAVSYICRDEVFGYSNKNISVSEALFRLDEFIEEIKEGKKSI